MQRIIAGGEGRAFAARTPGEGKKSNAPRQRRERHSACRAWLLEIPLVAGFFPLDSPRPCRGATTLPLVPGGCGPQNQRPSPPAMTPVAAPRRPDRLKAWI